eukprot:11195964-Lingulodinium_polyedra.AAC.1
MADVLSLHYFGETKFVNSALYGKPTCVDCRVMLPRRRSGATSMGTYRSLWKNEDLGHDARTRVTIV